MNICVFGSRRSATTALANALYSAMRTTGLSVQQQIEPFTWHMVQIDNVRQRRAHRISKEFHESIPLLCGPGFECSQLDAIMSFNGINVVKFNLALGRIPLIASYPDTVTIHIFRDPVRVINSLRRLNFDLGTIGIGRVRNDWDFFCSTLAPHLADSDNLVKNAVRWSMENLIAYGLTDYTFSYKRLLARPMEVARRIFDLIDHERLEHDRFSAFFRGFEARDTPFVLSGKEVGRIERLAGAAYNFLLSCEEEK